MLVSYPVGYSRCYFFFNLIEGGGGGRRGGSGVKARGDIGKGA